jgi:small subunit ribosomal protein S4
VGHPKRQRKKYERPKKPYDKERIEREKQIMKEFGLKRKREIWKAESILREFRRRARELQATKDEKKERELFGKLQKLGLIGKDAKLDDILDIKLEDILSRRLQTIVFKKGFSNTPKGARQLITHRHVYVNKRRLPWPSYLVPLEFENKIELNPKIKIQGGDK